MIHTATQLKAKIRNLSRGNSNKAQGLIPELPTVLAAVREDERMKRLWANYVRGSFYVDDVSWDDVMDSVESLAKDVE